MLGRGDWCAQPEGSVYLIVITAFRREVTYIEGSHAADGISPSASSLETNHGTTSETTLKEVKQLAHLRYVPVHASVYTVSMLASHQGDPDSIPGPFTPDSRVWESPLVGRSSRESLVPPAFPFRCRSILNSITLIGSQDLDVWSLEYFPGRMIMRLVERSAQEANTLLVFNRHLLGAAPHGARPHLLLVMVTTAGAAQKARGQPPTWPPLIAAAARGNSGGLNAVIATAAIRRRAAEIRRILGGNAATASDDSASGVVKNYAIALPEELSPCDDVKLSEEVLNYSPNFRLERKCRGWKLQGGDKTSADATSGHETKTGLSVANRKLLWNENSQFCRRISRKKNLFERNFAEIIKGATTRIPLSVERAKRSFELAKEVGLGPKPMFRCEGNPKREMRIPTLHMDKLEKLMESATPNELSLADTKGEVQLQSILDHTAEPLLIVQETVLRTHFPTEYEGRKEEITDRSRPEMGLLVDVVRQGRGTTNDGNTSRRFLKTQKKKSAEITRVDERLIHRLFVILRALSCGYDIDREA
ncbi:hypothetical protein PR048_024016 [Dryococelus australis]|uniref:Uncharacterized protein n=1 Tax=Dryococelus australis TaxID=614101 RepID=A0ABQ9GVQ6_9NEOP|nr:hypothetical protein PR048_024016 [Dryococelus australis]